LSLPFAAMMRSDWLFVANEISHYFYHLDELTDMKFGPQLHFTVLAIQKDKFISKYVIPLSISIYVHHTLSGGHIGLLVMLILLQSKSGRIEFS
jgi:hypothetical protein